MLRNISRALTRKQALMADHHSSKSPPTQNCRKPIPSLFGSLSFKAFTSSKAFPETDIALSPTSVLDAKLTFSPFYRNPFRHDNINPPNFPKNFSENKHLWEKNVLEYSKGVALALIDKPIQNNSSFTPNNNKNILFGTKLKVQIPSNTLSPCDFGIKTKNSVLTQSGLAYSGTHKEDTNIPPRVFCTGCLSETEMELSEDYTCVITHGPNPKTTRIFDNCIIAESYYSSPYQSNNSMPENFLSCCYTCKKNLEQKNDIYIYRGEKAFCSQECRYQEMLVDDAVE